MIGQYSPIVAFGETTGVGKQAIPDTQSFHDF